MQVQSIDVALPAVWRRWWEQGGDYNDSLTADDPAVGPYGVHGGDLYVGVYDTEAESLNVTGFTVVGDNTYTNGELYSDEDVFGWYWSNFQDSKFNPSGRIVVSCYQGRHVGKWCDHVVDVTDVDYATINLTTTTSLSRGISAYLKSDDIGTWPGTEYVLFSSHSVTGGTDNGDYSYTITIPIISLYYSSTYFVKLMYETVADPPSFESYSDDFTGVNGNSPNSDKWTVVSGSPQILNNTLKVTSSEGAIEKIASKQTFNGDVALFTEFSIRSENEGDFYVAALEMYIDSTHRVLVGPGRIDGYNKWIIMYQVGEEENWITWDRSDVIFGALALGRTDNETRVYWSFMDGETKQWGGGDAENLTTFSGAVTPRIYVGNYETETLASTTVLFDTYFDGSPFKYYEGDSQYLWSDEYKVVFSTNNGVITHNVGSQYVALNNSMYAVSSTDAGETFGERVHLFDTYGEDYMSMCEAPDGAIWFVVVDRTVDIAQRLRYKVYRYVVGESAVLKKTINAHESIVYARWTCVGVDPGKVVVMAAGETEEEAACLYISTDGGDTWEEKIFPYNVGSNQFENRNLMTLAGGNIIVFYIGSWVSGHLAISIDDGDTWDDISGVFDDTSGYFPAAWLNSCGSSVIFSCCHMAKGNTPEFIGFMLSEDAGTSWDFIECDHLAAS